jgi:O-antigen/teichoic acid export membrane protein
VAVLRADPSTGSGDVGAMGTAAELGHGPRVRPRVRVRNPRLAALLDHVRDPLFRNAYALMLSTFATGFVGVAFWALAARRWDAATVGQNSALIAAMMTVSTFAQFDLAAMLLRFLPRWRGTARRAVWTSYSVATGAAVVGSIGFVFVIHVRGDLSFLDDRWLAAAFCGAVVAWGIFAIQDGVLTGLGRAPVVPVENTSFGIAKLVLLAALAATAAHWAIFAAWTIPVVISLAPINLLIFRRYLPVHERRPARPDQLDRTTFARYLGFDYASSLCGAITTMAMPLLVIGLLGATDSGHFYVAWTLVLIVDTVALGLGSSLVVEGSFDPSRLAHDARRVLRRGSLLVLPIVAFVVVTAPLLLAIFGHDYSAASTSTLRILVLGIVPRFVIVVYASVLRVRGEVGIMLGVVIATTVLIVVGIVALAPIFGLTGVGVGWVLGYTVLAVAVAPHFRRLVRAAPPPVPVPDLVPSSDPDEGGPVRIQDDVEPVEEDLILIEEEPGLLGEELIFIEEPGPLSDDLAARPDTTDLGGPTLSGVSSRRRQG